MENNGKFAPKIHTESFYSDNRCYFIDLMPTARNEWCIRMALGYDKGERTEYARIILFEKDMQCFVSAFLGVMQEYIDLKKGKI